MSHYPILLTLSDLLAPIDLAKTTLSDVRKRIPLEKDALLVRKGLFVLAVSSFEVMISDVLTALLNGIPEKLPGKELSVPKRQLIERPFDVLGEQVEQHVRALSYKSLGEMLNSFAELTGISPAWVAADDRQSLQEIKETRNVLLHNGLRANSTYLTRAGLGCRASYVGEELSIDIAYLSRSLDVLERACGSCHMQIQSTYEKYTKVRAIRALWDYIFDSPILHFDDCWKIREDKDSVSLRTTDFGAISTSEAMFLGVWLNHYSGRGNDHIKDLHLRLLDIDRQQQLLWLVATLRSFQVY